MKTWALLLLALGGLPAWAQIQTDASLGQAPRLLNGPDYRIEAGLGRLAGSNLFHSFERFNLGRGETASFLTSGLSLERVIARVTGGEASLIQGQIRLEADSGRPALFLINPAGWLFGEGASLDLPGAFHVSSADSLRFADGARFHADPARASSFSSAPPEAFGFLGTGRGLIQVAAGAVLAGAPQQTLQLVAGDLWLDGGVVVGSGWLRAAAVGAMAGELALAGPWPAAMNGMNGTALLSQGALLGLGPSGGQPALGLQLTAGELLLFDASGLLSLSGDMELLLGERLLMDGASFLQTQSDTEAGGRLRLSAGSAQLGGEAYIETLARGAGAGGALELNLSQELLISGGAGLYSSSHGAGAGGALTVRAARLRFQDGVLLGQALGSGSGGALSLSASESLSLEGASDLRSQAGDSGAGGSLSLQAPRIDIGGDSLLLALGQAEGRAGGLQLRADTELSLGGNSQLQLLALGPGGSGELELVAGRLRIGEQAQLRATAVGAGHAVGALRLQVQGLLQIDGDALISGSGLDSGQGADLWLGAGELRLDGRAQVFSGSLDGGGRAGTIRLQAQGALSVGGQSTISANSFGDADAGAVQLQGQSLQVDGEARITSSTFEGLGRGGDIELRAERMQLSGQALLSSATAGPGDSGALRLIGGELLLSEGARLFTTASEPGAGHAGSIELRAERGLRLEGGARLDSSSFSLLGRAGDLLLEAGTGIELGQSALTSFSALGTGAAGRIELRSPGTLRLGPGSFLSTTTLAQGEAGSIALQGGAIELSGSEISSQTTPGSSGAGGSIRVSAAAELSLRGARLTTATGGSGAAGAIRLEAQQLSVGEASRVDAIAHLGSGGQPGRIELLASQSLRIDGLSRVEISNQATLAAPAQLQAGTLTLSAPRIEIERAFLSAAASGNTAASALSLQAADSIWIVDSLLSTSAQDGQGGPLSLQAGGLLALRRSALTTSVFGLAGDGGDIGLRAGLLLLDTGFVQANTAASGARGGRVEVEVGGLLASANRLQVGGREARDFRPERFGDNLIQAAAPGGLSGDITITRPVLDLSAGLLLLDARLLDGAGLGRDPCQRGGGSSLAWAGRGAPPPSDRGLLGATTPSAASSAGGCR